MKKTLIGTTLALFAFAPALAFADCGGMHQAAAMASASSDKAVASKATTPTVAKTTKAKQVKQASKKTSPSKTDGSTIVAKNN